MKTQFTFGFVDEPQFRTAVTNRQWLANYLRAARNQPHLRVRRIVGTRTAYAVATACQSAEALILPVSP